MRKVWLAACNLQFAITSLPQVLSSHLVVQSNLREAYFHAKTAPSLAELTRAA